MHDVHLYQFCIPLTFSNPLKAACFSNNKYPITFQTCNKTLKARNPNKIVFIKKVFFINDMQYNKEILQQRNNPL